MAKHVQAPKTAPTQTVAVTGKGPAAKAKAGHPAQPAVGPRPRMAATTGPKGSQSVDYDHNQASRVSGKPVPGTIDYVGVQSQQLQDKGTP